VTLKFNPEIVALRVGKLNAAPPAVNSDEVMG
jgi:hypothetical protein